MNPQQELKRMMTIAGYLSMIMLILALNADAQLIPTGVTEVQRLANGRTLITDSGANYVLALSGGQGPTRLGPGIGWVNLDPDAVLQLSLVAGALDVSGSTTTNYAIPALPALSALVLFGQAIIARIDDPILYTLTNPVSLTIF